MISKRILIVMLVVLSMIICLLTGCSFANQASDDSNSQDKNEEILVPHEDGNDTDATELDDEEMDENSTATTDSGFTPQPTEVVPSATPTPAVTATPAPAVTTAPTPDLSNDLGEF